MIVHITCPMFQCMYCHRVYHIPLKKYNMCSLLKSLLLTSLLSPLSLPFLLFCTMYIHYYTQRRGYSCTCVQLLTHHVELFAFRCYSAPTPVHAIQLVVRRPLDRQMDAVKTSNRGKQGQAIRKNLRLYDKLFWEGGNVGLRSEQDWKQNCTHTVAHTRTPKIPCILLILSSRFIDRTDSNRPDRILCLFPPAAPVAMRPASVGFNQHRRRGAAWSQHFSPHGMRWYAMRLFSLLALKTWEKKRTRDKIEQTKETRIADPVQSLLVCDWTSDWIF